LGDHLETELTVGDSVRSTLIPILSIQPLVENAVKHGVAAKQGHGRVSVRAEKVSAGLRITVEDTGVGFEPSKARPQDGTGHGLENVRRRLSLCYGSSAELQIRTNQAGTAVTFLVPDSTPAEYMPEKLEVEPDPLIT
jgi:two-component system LytT family sensor kinase